MSERPITDTNEQARINSVNCSRDLPRQSTHELNIQGVRNKRKHHLYEDKHGEDNNLQQKKLDKLTPAANDSDSTLSDVSDALLSDKENIQTSIIDEPPRESPESRQSGRRHNQEVRTALLFSGAVSSSPRRR
jgi:hypothetical protein